jgi:hypothetical protein
VGKPSCRLGDEIAPMPLPRFARRDLWPASAALAVALMAACTRATPEAFDARMRGFVGGPEAEVVAALGVPNRSLEADGRRLLQYDIAAPAPGPTITPVLGAGVGSIGWGGGYGAGAGVGIGFGAGIPQPPACTLTFEARDGRVTGFDRAGPGCVLAPPAAGPSAG